MLDVCFDRVSNTSPTYECYMEAFTPDTGTRVIYSPILLGEAMRESKTFIFNSLVDEWIAETKWHSSISRIKDHPNFAVLVEKGGPVVKLVLERMRAGDVHIHWFPLLREIAKHDPVPADKRGFVPEMAAAWIKWGEDFNKI